MLHRHPLPTQRPLPRHLRSEDLSLAAAAMAAAATAGTEPATGPVLSMTPNPNAARAPHGAVAAFSPVDADTDAMHRPQPGASRPQQGDAAAPVAVLLLADVAAPSRLWGWSRIVRGGAALRGEPGLRWAKVMGSGQGGGFGLRPSPSHQGLFAVFDDHEAAQHFVDSSALVARYRASSRECCTLLLRAWSSRGSWGGQQLPLQAAVDPGGPMAALTRASIRPLKAASFWAMAPAAQAALAHAPGCRLAAGLGEAPLLRQCTVSLWDSVAAMDAYARSGAHLQAIRAAAAQRFFSESMFVRFSVLASAGRWAGRDHG
jgi:hypothetical protein